MTTIAFTMIGHNEAQLLPRAMESVAWADELIYVDCGSNDNSSEVAGKYTDKVFSQPNNPNLNINKTYGIQQATTEWVFYLDPDEVISPELAAEIKAVIQAHPEENAFFLPRRNHFFGRWLRYGGQYPDTQLRLFRRGKASFACKDVHEMLDVDGKTGRLREAMDHFTSDTVMDSLKKLEFYSTFHGHKMARELGPPTVGLAMKFIIKKPAARFISRYLFKGGFLDGWHGFLQVCISCIDFQYRFLKYWHFATTGEDIQTGKDPNP